MTDPDDDDDQDEAPPDDAVWTHDPVMVEETFDLLLRRPSGEAAGVAPIFYDLTLGLGGHTKAFLDRCPDGRAYGLDGDPTAIERAGRVLAPYGDRSTRAHVNLRDVARAAKELGWPRPTAVLMDLGLSSPQVDEASRGFSYRQDGPLDMRFDPTQGPTANDLLHMLPTSKLAEEIERLGDEPLAPQIARLIKRNLPVDTTHKLARLVLEAYGKTPSRVHPARRTFQALRILVNDELGAVEAGLEGALELLVPGGRVAVLSYHSGEDRPVKALMKAWARGGRAELLTRRPVRPTDREAFSNPRARSAKLRGAQRI